MSNEPSDPARAQAIPIDAITIDGGRIREDMGDIDDLAESMRQFGMLQPVGISPDRRLSYGERRLLAAQRAGLTHVPVIIKACTEAERVLFEIEENRARKPFTPSEAVRAKRKYEAAVKAMAASRMKAGRPYANLAQGPKGATRDQLATLTGLGHTNLDKAAAIVEAAEAEPARFGKLVERMDSTGKIDPAFKLLKVARAREAYEARREKGGTVSDLVALAASGYRAGVIAPDCPWPFETWGGESGKDRAAENHYRTMTLAEIKAFGERYVKPLAAENCALLMWCTWPLVAPGDVLADIIRAWGFEPKTLGFIWIKTNQNGEGLHWGNGYYTRSKSEPVLLATRGSPLRLATDVHQVVMAPVGTHSAKPDEVYARIERLFAGPYLELFARKPRPRWTTWGDEVPPCVLQDGEVLS